MAKTRAVTNFRSQLAAHQKPIVLRGVELTLRYVPLDTWLAQGEIPQQIASLMFEDEPAESGFDDMQADPNEGRLLLEFRRKVVEFAALSPRISYSAKRGEEKDDEVTAEEILEICPELLDDIFLYATRRLAQSRIQTDSGGEVSVSALKQFRDDEERPAESVTGGAGGGDVRSATILVTGAER